jgi:hypothetical protein
MTIGELADLEAKRTPGTWRWDPDAESIDAHHEGHVSSVAYGVTKADHNEGIEIEPHDAAVACAAVNALGPLLKLLAKCERAANSEDEHAAMDDVRDAVKQARKEIENAR